MGCNMENTERIQRLERNRVEDLMRMARIADLGGESAREIDALKATVAALEQRLQNIEDDLDCERNTVGRGGEV